MLETATHAVVRNERRLADRRGVGLPAEVQLWSGSVGLRTSSVSTSGVFLSSSHAPPVGFALHLTLHLPDGPLECVATVVRALPGRGFACRIAVPGIEERRRWWSFLDTLPQPVAAERSATFDPREWFDFGWTNAGGAEPG